MSRRIRVLAVLWAVAIAVLLLWPVDVRSRADLPGALLIALELLAHLALFFGQSRLAARGYANSSGGEPGPEIAGRRSRILAAVLAYCVVLEIAQIAVPGRSFEFADIAAGWLGAVLGIRGWFVRSR